MTTTITKDKKQLVEELGLDMETHLQVSPLAARIYALLVLSPTDGLTFDEIQAGIQASKSSVSNNLKVLTQLRYVEYHTKPGIRKRFFKIAKYYQLLVMERRINSLEQQIEMIQKINAFNQEHYPEKQTNHQSLGKILQDYLADYRTLVKKTVDEISAFREAEG